MNVEPEKAATKLEHAGKTYFFCSSGCAARFQKQPEKFLASPETPRMAHRSTVPGKKESTVSSPREGARYTCPMHPEIVLLGPGTCPICGMALEPMDVLAEVEAEPEYGSMRLRFWVSAVLSLPVLGISMFGEYLGPDVSPVLRNWIELALATPVVLWGGWPFFKRFWASLVHGSPNMFTLIGLGTGVISIRRVAPPSIYPRSLAGSVCHARGSRS